MTRGTLLLTAGLGGLLLAAAVLRLGPPAASDPRPPRPPPHADRVAQPDALHPGDRTLPADRAPPPTTFPATAEGLERALRAYRADLQSCARVAALHQPAAADPVPVSVELAPEGPGRARLTPRSPSGGPAAELLVGCLHDVLTPLRFEGELPAPLHHELTPGSGMLRATPPAAEGAVP